MAFTRKMLKALGIDEEKIDQIMEAHAEVVDGLKNQNADNAKTVEELTAVKAELESMKHDDYKAKYEAEKKAHADFRASIESEKARSVLESAVKAYYESKNIMGKNLSIAMRGTSLDGLEMDGDHIKDTSAIDALISGDFATLVSTEKTLSAPVPNPPTTSSSGEKMTKDEFGKLGYTARVELKNSNPDLYRELSKT